MGVSPGLMTRSLSPRSTGEKSQPGGLTFVLVVVAEGVSVGRSEELLGSGAGLGTVVVMDGQQEVEQAVHQVIGVLVAAQQVFV
ncbi:MAG: hypothetical protein M5U05_18320 [Anaerolineales bacterium]|nr:hypothetical protein [Anaerolineales bacterium]